MRLQILFHPIALYEEYSNCSTGFDNVVFGKKVMLSAFSSEASIILQRTLLVYLLTYVKYMTTQIGQVVAALFAIDCFMCTSALLQTVSCVLPCTCKCMTNT